MSEILNSVLNDAQLTDELSFIDLDTIQNREGESFRLQGFDAPEVSKYDESGKMYDSATAGGYEAGVRLQRLAKQMGYTNLVPLDEMDATGTRRMAVLRNAEGRDFTSDILRSGGLRTGKYTTKEDLDAVAVADLFRNHAKTGDDAAWAQAGEDVANMIEAEQGRNLQFREAAPNEQFYGMRPDLYSSAIQFRNPDRDIRNNALNPMSEAWDSGLNNVAESAFGVINMLGHSTSSDFLKSVGEEGVARWSAKTAENAHFLTDYKDVDSFGDAVDFLANNFAMSLPYLAFTALGSMSAPLMVAPVALYTGNTWNEMEGENKNVGLAIGSGIAQATIDRLGFTHLLGQTKAPKEILKAAVEELVKRGETKEAAEAIVNNASRKEMAILAGDAAKVAKDQLGKKQFFKDLTKRVSTGMGSEGLTEAVQETIGYLSAHSQEGFDWDDLTDRVVNASLAGGSIGGTFGAAGAINNRAGWEQANWALGKADEKYLSQAGRYAEQELKDNGYVPTIQEINASWRARPEGFTPFDARVDQDTQARKSRTAKEIVFDTLAAAPKLWRGSTRAIFKPEILMQSKTARQMADMFGGGLQRIYGGSNMENWKHHRVTKYRNMLPTPAKFFSAFNGGKEVSRKQRGEISKQFYDVVNNAINKTTNKFDPNMIPQDTPNRAFIIDTYKKMAALADQVHKDSSEFDPKLGYIHNYAARYKAFDKHAIAADKMGFINALVEHAQVPEAEAHKIYEGITTNPNVNDIDEAFSITQGAPVPGSHKKRSLNLAERPEFAKFMSQDIFENMDQMAKSATRFQAHAQFVGKNGSHLAKMFDQMEKEGLSKDVVNRIAGQMKDYLDAESGNYKRPTSEFGKWAMGVQQNFMMLSMFAGLGLSTFSSLPELALTTKALNNEQLFGKNGLRAMAKELAKTMADLGSFGARQVTGKVDKRDRSKGQKIIAEHGYEAWEVGAATTTGVTETNKLKQRYVELFFKWNGLQGYTNMTRAIRASFAGDYIFSKLDTIRDAQGKEKTNEVQEAEEALRNLGLDPIRVVKILDQNGPLTPEQDAQVADLMREATFNFINDAVALPQAQNRPLIYQDPRFALFNQFQGFIATITANHIPKMWGEYIKRGSPAMKFNTFSTMAIMIALAFLSQAIKDELKYGEESPYLDDAEKIRRGISSSGLLGSAERVINTLMPMYDEKSDSALGWVWNEVSGQSPGLSNVTSLGKAGADLMEGDVHGATKGVLRNTPFIAPLTGVRNEIADFAGRWNFKGD